MEQGVSGADDAPAGRGKEAVVAAFRISHHILIEEKVAVVLPISKVVDHEQPSTVIAEGSLPAAIDGIVVNDEPVRFSERHRGEGRVRVSLPIGAEPGGISRL